MVSADINELLMLLSAACVVAGWRQIRRGRRAAHRRLMLAASLLATGFFLSYALRSLLVGDTSFGGPPAWRLPYLTFLQVHTILATAAAVLGVVTLRFALSGRFAKHRRIAPWTAVSWLIAAAMGLTVFLMLYVVFPPGPTSSMARAILGR